MKIFNAVPKYILLQANEKKIHQHSLILLSKDFCAISKQAVSCPPGLPPLEWRNDHNRGVGDWAELTQFAKSEILHFLADIPGSHHLLTLDFHSFLSKELNFQNIPELTYLKDKNKS